MSKELELQQTLWKALKSDMTLMLALSGVEEGHSHPMTAQFDPDRPDGPIWFFTSRETDLVRAMGERHRAVAHFAAKDHELFASMHGTLVLDNDPATIDRLWNRYVAAWFKGGKQDPLLQLLRFDAERGQVWLNDSSLLAGVKMVLGMDPKKAYNAKVAEVDLR